jgi:glycosyltransferase involved in cell wall biosynthesis
MGFLKKKLNKLPTVAVVICAFNQESTIAEALRGVMNQKVNFPLEIIVHDDCSTDNTVNEIYKTLADSPFPYKVLVPKLNQYQFGMDFFYNLLSDCSSKYVSLCDGDDLWSDSLKLQKQINLMESEPAMKISHHRFAVVDLMTDDLLYEWPPIEFRENLLLGTELSKENFIGSLTVVFRRDSLPPRIPGYSKLGIGDYGLWGLISQNSPIGYIDESMAKYRLHDNQIFSSRSTEEKTALIKETKIFVSENSSGEVQEIWKKAANESQG